MFSIIVCSRHKQINAQMEANIKATIGLTYEIIWIDNSDNHFNIAQAYDYGVSKAQYPYLCFVHEDVVFHSNNWGQAFINALNKDNVGMAGILGGYYFGKLSMGWIGTNLEYAGNCIQGDHNGLFYYTYRTNHRNIAGNEVSIIDGFLFCLSKKLFDNGSVKWDGEQVQGYAHYSFDMSLQVHMLGLKNIVVDDVLVEHKSPGPRSGSFYKELVQIHKKWNKCLPVKVEAYKLPKDYEDEEIYLLEKYCHAVQRADKIRNYFSFLTKMKRYIYIKIMKK